MGCERAIDIEICGDVMTIYLDQGDRTEDEFYEYVADYIFRNINIEVN